jgi:hypothetical protein
MMTTMTLGSAREGGGRSGVVEIKVAVLGDG